MGLISQKELDSLLAMIELLPETVGEKDVSSLQNVMEVVKETGMPEGLIMKSFVVDEINKPAFLKAVEFLKKPTNGLFVWGLSGVGKSMLLSAVCKELCLCQKAGLKPHFQERPAVSIRWMNGVEFAAQHSRWRVQFGKEGENPAKPYLRCGHLFVDDLCRTEIDATSTAAIGQILDFRYDRNLPVSISSNCDMKGVAEKYGIPIMSRIMGGCEVIEMKGKDRRGRR